MPLNAKKHMIVMKLANFSLLAAQNERNFVTFAI
jgi:hypothetical protein